MKSLLKILFALIFTCFQAQSYSQVALEEQSSFLDSVITDLQNSKDPLMSIDILDQQLNIKAVLIDKIKFQIIQIDKDIRNNEIYYERLNSQLQHEKNIYSDLIVKAYRLNSLVHEKFDIFSLDNLYTTYRRFLYIKQLADYRKKKIKSINNLKAQIAQVVQELDNDKHNKSQLASKIGVEESFIKQYAASKSRIIRDFNREQKLNSDRIKRNSVDFIMNQDLIISETSADSTTLFQVQKGYLIWPVKKAVIINTYGEKPHPVYDNVTVKNDGLDFCVPSDSDVLCVYNGVVAKISELPTGKYAVIVRHGKYFTVYNGLDDVDVDEGDDIEKGEELGSFDTDETHSMLNFQIWLGSETLDPQKWLVKLPSK